MYIRCKLALSVLVVVLGTAPAHAKPAPSTCLELSFQREPALNEPMAVTIKVHSATDRHKAKLALDLPPGIAPTGEQQNLHWLFDLAAESSKEFSIEVIIEQPGEYRIAARFAAKDSARVIHTERALYLVITEDWCVYTNCSPSAARRAAVLEKYRRERGLAPDAEINIEELPAEVRAALDELSRVETAPQQNSQPKVVKRPDGAEAAETAQPVTEKGETPEQ